MSGSKPRGPSGSNSIVLVPNGHPGWPNHLLRCIPMPQQNRIIFGPRPPAESWCIGGCKSICPSPTTPGTVKLWESLRQSRRVSLWNKTALKGKDTEEKAVDIGAGEGNRTLVSGLGSPQSTIEPNPRQ